MTELLTLREAASLLKVAPSFLYARTRVNAVPVKRIGRLIRFDRAELEAWISGQPTDLSNAPR